tara:strand:- start:41 stop:1513 length:1473 start_codon:yes stop_codon:yes gene_type:complete
MAQSLTQSVINRIVVNQPADYKDESYSGNLDVSSINSMLIHCRKENIRVFARVTATQVWNVLGVVGDALDSVSGMGTEYRREATFDVALMDRVSITSLGAETKARVIFNPTLPASLTTSSGGGASVTEYAMTNLVSGEAQTVAVGAGDAFVQVYDEVLPANGKEVLTYTGADQSFVVPAGVTSITAKLWGAGGGGGHAVAGNPPQAVAGGYTTGDISVTPGETLTLVVGQGGGYTASGNTHTPTTYGGGGRGYVGNHTGAGGGGGGLAGIFRGSVDQANALLIAAGSGGVWGYNASPAQAGTGLVLGYAGGIEAVTPHGGESHATNNPGGPGTQSQGGKAGNWASGVPSWNGTAGTALQGGDGGHVGGGGGAGYFGGGGGAHVGYGGGGSAFLGTATNASTIASTGVNPPNASDADYVAGVGVGGDQGVTIGSNPAGYGGNALIVISYSTGGSSTLEATTAHTIAHDSTAGTVTITPASNVANAKLRIVK